MKAGLVAAGAIAVGAVVGAKKAIDAASDLGESINAVNVVFEEGADRIHEWGKTSATQAGLSQRAFNEAVTPIGAALRNVGLGADEAAQKSIELTQRAADMASVFNVDVSDALTAIQAGLRGEADPLERFGVGLSETAIQAFAVKTGMAEAGTELTAQQKIQARLALLMEQTNRVAGDFVNTSGGLANQQRILRARLEDVAASIGQILMPAVLKVVGFLNDTAVPALESFTGFLQRIFAARTLRAKVNIVWEGIQTTAEDLFDKIRTALFGGPAEPLRLDSGKILEWDQRSTQGLLDKFAPVLASGDWTAIGAAVGKGIGEAIKFSAGTLNNLLNQLVAWVDDHSRDLGRVGLKIVLEMVNAMTDPAFWRENWKLIASVLLTLLPVGRVLKIGGRIAQLVVKAFGTEAGVLFVRFIDTLPRIFSRVPGILRAAFKISVIFTFISAVETGIRNLIQWLKDRWNDLPGIIRTAVSGIGTILLNAFIGPISTIIGKLQDLYGWFQNVLGAASNLGSSVGSVAGSVVPRRAAGGPVTARRSYLVGERGPELFTPRMSGNILANTALATTGGGGIPGRGATIAILEGDRETIAWLRDLFGSYGSANGGLAPF